MPRGTRVKKDGLAIIVESGGAHLKQDCPQASKLPPAPCLVCKEPHWRRDCPQRHRFQGSDSQDNQVRLKVPEGPYTSSHPNYT